MNSREAFEAWASDNGEWPQTIQKFDHGGYRLMDTAVKWAAWKAATERAAKLCEDDECDQDEYRCGTTARIAAAIRGHDRA